MTPDMEVPTRAGGLQNQPLFRAFAHRMKGSRGGGEWEVYKGSELVRAERNWIYR